MHRRCQKRVPAQHKCTDRAAVRQAAEQSARDQIPAQNAVVPPIQKHCTKHTAQQKIKQVKDKLHDMRRISPSVVCPMPGRIGAGSTVPMERAASASAQTRSQPSEAVIRIRWHSHTEQNGCCAEQVIQRTEQNAEKQCRGHCIQCPGSTCFRQNGMLRRNVICPRRHRSRRERKPPPDSAFASSV